MNVEKTSQNYNNIKLLTPQYMSKTAVSLPVQRSQSFGNGFAGNSVIGLMDMVERGGLVASFLIQDFFGMGLPRTVTGLYRNKEITNQYNYQEAAEVAIRELVSGPILFVVPMAMIWGIKRLFGSANNVPVSVMRIMGDNLSQNVTTKSIEELSDVKNVKQFFYKDVFKNILKNAYENNVSDDVVEKQSNEFVKDLLEYEKLVSEKKTKPFWAKVTGKKVEGTADEKLSEMVGKFANIRKANSANNSSNFLNATIKGSDKETARPLAKLVVDMKNYIEDFSKSVAKKAKGENFDATKLQDFVKSFTDFRSGSRVLTNISMIAGVIAFSSIVPKLYQLNEKNPGLAGLDKESLSANNQDNNVKQGTKVAFSGAIDKLGRTAGNQGFWGKLFKEFEFDNYTLSFMGLLATCGIGVLVPRLYHAREENEYKEVLFRDTTSILTMAGFAKIMQQIVARVCTNKTGLALSIKPDGERKTTWAKIYSYLKPINGHKVLNSDDLYTKYTHIDKYKNGILGFFNFIDEQGGNIGKVFKIDENANNLLKSLYEKSAKNDKTVFDKATNKEIIEAVKEVVENQKDDGLLNKIYDIFKDDKNKFLRKAKVMNSSFNFALLFIAAPVLLGVLIPRMNEVFTKKRQLSKHLEAQEDKQPTVQEKLDKPKQELPMNTVKVNQKTFSAFDYVNKK